MKKTLFILHLVIIGMTGYSQKNKSWMGDSQLKPWVENRSYWQYKGKPVLLLGGTMNDNLFQNENVTTHLDSLKKAGGNVIRNTMSDRDPGNLHAFLIYADGKYDLNEWNDEYWKRFETLLKLAHERDIIVQIEVWDRFDHSRDPWKTDPFNPSNNINYSASESGLEADYPLHPGQNTQPFFFTVPDLENNRIVLNFQQKYVEKLLSISLNFDNILYCIDNETSGKEEWAAYWAEFIRSHSGGRDIYITEMWDSWDVKSATHKRTIDHPELYRFIDISQNSQITGSDNWKNAEYVFNYIKNNPRPVNSTKIYGSDNGSWLDRGINTRHGINTFFRNILGGFASSRFHRPPSGLGLSSISINCIKTIRAIEKKVKIWELTPRMDLIENPGKNEVYMAASDGKNYLLFFPDSGMVRLDLTRHKKPFTLNWITISDAKWNKKKTIQGGGFVNIETQNSSGSLALITLK